MRVASCAMAVVSAMPGRMMANSSPPRRATRSPWRTQASMRCATCLSSSSPRAWPRVSLTSLKLSRSSSSSATLPCRPAALCMAPCSCSRNMARLGRPVSSSKCAWRQISASWRFLSVTSLSTTVVPISRCVVSAIGVTVTSTCSSCPWRLFSRQVVPSGRFLSMVMLCRPWASSSGTMSANGLSKQSPPAQPSSSSAGRFMKPTRPWALATTTQSLMLARMEACVMWDERRLSSTWWRCSATRSAIVRSFSRNGFTM